MSRVKIIPVILCGGSGSRLWPLSRPQNPKQFLRLFGRTSLVQETTLRAQRACGVDNEEIVFVSLAAFKFRLKKHLGEIGKNYDQHILLEPAARNTAAAVALAADYVHQKFGSEAIMWVLPSDHFIGDEEGLASALEAAVQTAQKDKLVTFGIRPKNPETGYGYIRHNGKTYSGGVLKAERFVEKPDRETAKSYLGSGDYLWNSGMFIFKATKILQSYEAHASEIFARTRRAAADNAKRPCLALYKEIPRVPFDKAVMEKSTDIAVVPCDIGWSDIGSWNRLAALYWPGSRKKATQSS